MVRIYLYKLIIFFIYCWSSLVKSRVSWFGQSQSHCILGKYLMDECYVFTIIIGTSLVQGLGNRLHSLGLDATCYMYRGADIPTIQSRIPNILTPGVKPKRIILQVGGNDATKRSAESIGARYESFITDISRRCPQTTVILSKVPPRRGTARTMQTLHEINNAMDNFADCFQNVCTIDVCPVSIAHFKKDCTHFNANGLALYATNLAMHLRNFQRPRQIRAL